VTGPGPGAADRQNRELRPVRPIPQAREALCGLQRALAPAGLTRLGVLAAADYDARVPAAWSTARCLPGARSAVVLAGTGRDLERALAAAAQPLDAEHPVDRFTRRAVLGALSALEPPGIARAAFYWERRGGRFADFVALARAAGLGTPGRLGLLMHPEAGPWLAIRAVVLTRVCLAPTPPPAPFDPCRDCPAPCARACPAGALASGRLDPRGCGVHRGRGGCAERCDARRACPQGAEHAPGAGLEALHMRAGSASAAAGGVATGPGDR